MKEESLLLLSDLQKLINQVVLIDYTIIILGGYGMKKAKANSGKAGWMMRLTGFSYVGRIENLRDLVYYKLYGKDNFWFPFEVSDMVKNNIELDVKTKCIEQGKTQVNLAEEIETTKAYVNRVIKKQDGVVNQTFVKMMEALGYDIELRYVERK